TGEGSSGALAALPERPHWPLGHLTIPPPVPKLLVPWLQAHLQRPHQCAAASESATTVILDSRHLSVVSRLFVPAHRQRARHSYPDQLPLVLVAAQRRLVL